MKITKSGIMSNRLHVKWGKKGKENFLWVTFWNPFCYHIMPHEIVEFEYIIKDGIRIWNTIKPTFYQVWKERYERTFNTLLQDTWL